MQPEVAFLSRQSRLKVARRAIRRADELRIAPPAVAALGDDDADIGRGQVGELNRFAFGGSLVDDGANRHLEDDVGAALAGTPGAFAVRTAGGLEFLLEAIVEEGIQVGAGDHVDRSAVAAVAAIGAAAWHELLATKAEGSRSAVSRSDVDIYFVDKHGSRQSSVFCRQSGVGSLSR